MIEDLGLQQFAQVVLAGVGLASDLEGFGPSAAALQPPGIARRLLRPGFRVLRNLRKLGATSARTLGLGSKARVRSAAPPPELPAALIALQSTEGAALLYGAEVRTDFLPLSLYFVTQESPTLCVPATMAMLLNALGAPRPPSVETLGHGLFDQHNVFTPRVQAIKPRHRVVREGMSLRDFGKALIAHDVRATVRYAQDTDLDGFRAEAAAVLDAPERFVAVNYQRSALGKEAGGHTSPLAAYNGATDRFLILDVARYRYPPVWVGAAALFEAMAAKTGGGVSRGYVIVEL